MRIRSLVSFLLMLTTLGCEHDDNSIPKIEGLSFYWDHEVFGYEGRRLRFEGYTTNKFDNDYDLEFNTLIRDKFITAHLVKSIDKGKCQYFPMPVIGDYDPYKCNASGGFFLSDKELDIGIYSLTIVTPYFEVTSKLIVTDEKVTLEIPENKYINSSIEEVYPLPKNLLFGGIVYQNSNNTNDAEGFLDYLINLGLIKTTLPDYAYRHLNVDENGAPINNDWEPDNHSIGLLYNMNNVDFKTIFEESMKYFNQTNLNIYLYTSNGDQGFLSKTDGITVVYGK